MSGLAIRVMHPTARQLVSRSRALTAAFGILISSAASCGVDDRNLTAKEPSNEAGRAGSAGTPGGSGGKGVGGSSISGDAGERSGSAGSGEGGQAPVDPGQCPDRDENSVPDCEETVVTNSTFDQNTSD